MSLKKIGICGMSIQWTTILACLAFAAWRNVSSTICSHGNMTPVRHIHSTCGPRVQMKGIYKICSNLIMKRVKKNWSMNTLIYGILFTYTILFFNIFLNKD